jgi:hypothetical protein
MVLLLTREEVCFKFDDMKVDVRHPNLDSSIGFIIFNQNFHFQYNIPMDQGRNDNDSNVISSVDEKVQHVFDLLVACTQGEVSNDVVEDAIDQLIGSPPPVTKVQEDTDNYDVDVTSTSKPIIRSELPTKVLWKGKTASVEDLQQDGEEEQNSNDPFARFPMGKYGKKMFITFGGGNNPSPEAVETTLLGTRKLLQNAVKDARALRRKLKEEYAHAKRVINMGNKRKKDGSGVSCLQTTVAEAADPSMYFRCIDAYDRLAYNPKCGFDVEQLQHLFPEEMTAYHRWNCMHKEFQSSEKTDNVLQEKVSNEGEEVAAGLDDENKFDEHHNDVVGGHLSERALNFDIRTDFMKNDAYIEFSKIRRAGSFLPRKLRPDREEQEWERVRTFGPGRRKDGTWDFMSIISVKFLHWVGFDPKSDLAPPDEFTTEALAYLGHDFFGRIVERAIQIRMGEQDGDYPEMPPGEQLTREDIKLAIEDSTLNTVSLYTALDDNNDLNSSTLTTQSVQQQPRGQNRKQHHVAAQLYFGPGFERRMEMELEELVKDTSRKRRRLTDEEIQTRKREDELFAMLSKPPQLLQDYSELIY